MADDADTASVQIAHYEKIIMAAREQNTKLPVFDADGEKVCIECDGVIEPPARAAISTVCRCMDCQIQYEKGEI